ncbi:hypothetical protein Tco_0085205 [Tanacetum coccineum]
MGYRMRWEAGLWVAISFRAIGLQSAETKVTDRKMIVTPYLLQGKWVSGIANSKLIGVHLDAEMAALGLKWEGLGDEMTVFGVLKWGEEWVSFGA